MIPNLFNRFFSISLVITFLNIVSCNNTNNSMGMWRQKQNYNFKSNNPLQRNINTFVCEICNITIFNNEDNRQRHLKSKKHLKKVQENENNKNCFCEICNIANFSSEYQRQEHLKGKKHLKKVQLNKHPIKVSQIQLMNRCKICGKDYTDEQYQNHTSSNKHKRKYELLKSNNLTNPLFRSINDAKRTQELLGIDLTNIKALNKNGQTPFDYACKKGTLDVVEQYICHMSNYINIKLSASSPLHYACIREDDDARIAMLLIKLGADIEAKNTNKLTPLQEAFKAGNIRMVDSLIKCNADITIKDRDKRTLLHNASDCKNEELMQLIFKATKEKLDLESKGKYGMTPFQVACGYKNISYLKILLDNGANINVKIDKKTPLIYAVELKNLEMMKLLLENYISTEEMHYDKTPLDIAINLLNDAEVVKSLLMYGAKIEMSTTKNHSKMIRKMRNKKMRTYFKKYSSLRNRALENTNLILDGYCKHVNNNFKIKYFITDKIYDIFKLYIELAFCKT